MIMSRKAITIVVSAFALLSFSLGSARAQGPSSRGIPDDVFYLMPSFTDGMVYFEKRAPAQGKMNICAVDHSLRFLDGKGQELEAADISDVVKVVLDTVTFLRKDEAFLRLYPDVSDVWIAGRRDVKIVRGAKKGAYGSTSQTSSISEVGSLYTEGMTYNLSEGREAPYEVSETFYLYKGGSLYPVTKRGLRKLFPEKKAQVDAYFQSRHPAPDSISAVREILANFLESE